MQTDTRIEFSFVDVTARADSTPASADAQPWCDVKADLCRENIPQHQKYGTLEPRQCLMDGSFALFPNAPKGNFWGAVEPAAIRCRRTLCHAAGAGYPVC